LRRISDKPGVPTFGGSGHKLAAMQGKQLHSALLWTAALCLTAAPALAQYKVVQPDGSVTYTDRPVANGTARITQLGARTPTAAAAATAADSGLPPDLRLVAQRYPVTLFTASDCQPCEAGRRLLQQRGVPYSEKRIINDDDLLALERLAGGRTLPAVTIGAQPLRGFSAEDWTSYLDSAGYPAQSKLPRGWKLAEPTPLAERAPPPPQPPPRALPSSPPTTPPPVKPGGIRF
jgi:glutaredoxin